MGAGVTTAGPTRSAIESSLNAIFDQVRILSATSVEISGELIETHLHPLENEHSSPSDLVRVLTQELYRRFYCRSAPPSGPESARAGPSTDLLSRLSAANAGEERTVTGWRVLSKLENGKCLARRHGRTCAFHRHQLLPSGGGAPDVGTTVDVFVPTESVEAAGSG